MSSQYTGLKTLSRNVCSVSEPLKKWRHNGKKTIVRSFASRMVPGANEVSMR